MKPILFPGCNVEFAKDQPEYLPLPAILCAGDEGRVISCWELTDEEIAIISKTRKIYLNQLTFNQKLQPQRLQVELDDIEFIDSEVTNENS